MVEIRRNDKTGELETWRDGKMVEIIADFVPSDEDRGDAVDSYRMRRDARRRARLDAEEPEAWITVNGNHIPLNEEGEVIGGQPRAFGESNLKEVRFASAKPSSRIKKMTSTVGAKDRKAYSAAFDEYASKMTELNARHREEDRAVDKQKVPAKDKDYSRLWEVSGEIRELREKILSDIKGMPSGTVMAQGSSVYQKDGNLWRHFSHENPDDDRVLSDDTICAWVCGEGHLADVAAVRFPESTDDVKLVKSIEKKSDAVYKDFADAINNLDKKGVVAKAKKDPEFKGLVDSITLYTQGAYDQQKDLARDMVQNGLEETPISTVSEYYGDGFYDIRQLWNGQKLKDSETTLAEGVLSMMGAINNSEPTQKTLFRIEGNDKYFNVATRENAYIPPKIGDVISFDAPTSFTKSKAVEESLRSYKYGDLIHYELEPGANALDIERLSRYKQQESITCGKYEVTDIRYSSLPTGLGWRSSEQKVKDALEEIALREQKTTHSYRPLDVTITLRQVGKTEIGGRSDSAELVIRYDDQFNDRMGLDLLAKDEGRKDVAAYRKRRADRCAK